MMDNVTILVKHLAPNDEQNKTFCTDRPFFGQEGTRKRGSQWSVALKAIENERSCAALIVKSSHKNLRRRERNMQDFPNLSDKVDRPT